MRPSWYGQALQPHTLLSVKGFMVHIICGVTAEGHMTVSHLGKWSGTWGQWAMKTTLLLSLPRVHSKAWLPANAWF